MMQKPDRSMDEVIQEDRRYPLEAYRFLHEGLARAVQSAYGDKPGQGGQQHVTGKQMCEALRALAAERWGMLAPKVLARWKIRATIDFGHMVYLLIDNEFMHKTPEDSVEDFRDAYDFSEAFRDVDDFELTS